MSERALAQAEVSQQQEILQTIIDHLPVLVSFIDQRGQIQLVNPEWERTIGWSLEEIRKQQLDIFAECYPDPQYRQQVMDFIANSNGEWADFKTKVRDGRIIDLTWAVVHICDGTLIGIGQDLTERKRREEDLYAFTAAMENAVVGISRLDARGNYVSVNSAYASALGYTSTQMRGLSREATVYPADREKMHEAYQQMLAHGRAEVEVRGLRQDGSVFYKQVVMVKTQGSQGEFLGHYCFMKDISEKKAAEETLYKEREFLQAVLESIDEGIIVCDANGVLSLFNRSTREIMKEMPNPFLPVNGRNTISSITPGGNELLDPNDIPLIRALRGEPVRDAEIVIKTPAGKERTQLCNARALHDSSGNLLGAVVAHHDVTEQRLAEETQRKLADERDKLLRRLQLQIERMPLAYVIVDADHRVLEWNAAAERVFGYRKDEVLNTIFIRQVNSAISQTPIGNNYPSSPVR